MSHPQAPNATTEDVIGTAIALVQSDPRTRTLGAQLVAEHRPYQRLLTASWAEAIAETI